MKVSIEIQVGKTWHEVIESAERFIHRHGGKPAFPATISVNEIAAHFTTEHSLATPPGWEGDMMDEENG